MTDPTTTPTTPEERLAPVVGLLHGAQLAADAATKGDPLSPWANVAMSAHLAAALLGQHLTWPPPARIARDCAGSLRAAADELDGAALSAGLPADDLVVARGWLSTAIADADRLQSP